MDEQNPNDVTSNSFISPYNSPDKPLSFQLSENEENITPQSNECQKQKVPNALIEESICVDLQKTTSHDEAKNLQVIKTKLEVDEVKSIYAHQGDGPDLEKHEAYLKINENNHEISNTESIKSYTEVLISNNLAGGDTITDKAIVQDNVEEPKNITTSSEPLRSKSSPIGQDNVEEPQNSTTFSEPLPSEASASQISSDVPISNNLAGGDTITDKAIVQDNVEEPKNITTSSEPLRSESSTIGQDNVEEPQNSTTFSEPLLSETSASQIASDGVVNNHTSPAISPSAAAEPNVSKPCRNINLSAFNLNEEEEKILSEMMASSSSNCGELSNSEMLSVSQRMEAEFREMVLQEKLLKKQTIEGPACYSAEKSLDTSSSGHNIKSANNESNYKRSKLPKSKIIQPWSPKYSVTLPLQVSKQRYQRSENSTVQKFARPNRSAIVISPSSTPRTPSSVSSSAKSSPHHRPFSAASTNSRSAGKTTPEFLTPRTFDTQSGSARSRRLSTSSTSSSCSRMSLKNVQGKIGSFSNINHVPGGGNVRIETRFTDYSGVTAKCGSKENIKYTPGGGKVKIETKKLDFSNVSSKCESKGNLHHTPGGGKVKIETKKLNFSNVTSKCGSKDNINYAPSGGKVKIETKKLDFSNVSSKCGSKTNINHTPSGGKVKIETKKLDFSNVTSKCGSKDNINHTPRGGKVKIETKKLDFSNVASKCGSKDNISHKPGGGKVKIETKKIDFSNVSSKCGSKDNINHKPTGGKVKIETKRVDFSKVASKCGSKDNIYHKPSGGKVKIETKKLDFSKVASKCGSKDNIHHTPSGGKDCS